MKPKPGPVCLLLFQLFQLSCSSVEKVPRQRGGLCTLAPGPASPPSPPFNIQMGVHLGAPALPLSYGPTVLVASSGNGTASSLKSA